jgi:hypothetical protein
MNYLFNLIGHFYCGILNYFRNIVLEIFFTFGILQNNRFIIYSPIWKIVREKKNVLLWIIKTYFWILEIMRYCLKILKILFKFPIWKLEFMTNISFHKYLWKMDRKRNITLGK